MIIYKDKALTESALTKEGHFEFDFGTVKAGSQSVKEYFIHNPKDCDVINITMTFKPVVEIKEGIERNYTQCIQEIEVKHLPKSLKPGETKMFEITYTPQSHYFRALKLGIEIDASEIPL